MKTDIDFKKLEKMLVNEMYAIWELRKSIVELRISQEETDKKFQETDRLFKETDKKFKETDRKLSDLGISQWDIAEDAIWRKVWSVLWRFGISIDEVKRNITTKSREYDLIAINGKYVVLIEVKNKVRMDDVNKLLSDQLKSFRSDFPEYKKHKLYWWIWWLVVRSDIEKYAEKKWLFVITQSWDIVELANKKGFEPVEF
jgi:hypothetical protein